MAQRNFAMAPLVVGLGLGAGIMYLMDPNVGRRRRAIARDKSKHYLHEAEDAMSKATRDLSNRTRGVVAETRKAIRNRELPHLTSQFEFGKENWSPAARLIGTTIGLGLTAAGFRASFPVGCTIGTLGALFAARAITNTPLSELARLPEGVAEAGGMAVAR